MNSRVAALSLIFTLLLLTGVVGHILPVQSQLNPGDILVVDNSYTSDYTGGMGALFRVNPTTGERTILSDFSVGANQGCWPFGVAVERSGKILVVDPCANVLFRVDPTTGSRTILSDFNVGANQGVDPVDVAVESSGNILVVDATAKLLFRIDPITGERTVLSDFGVGDNQGVEPWGVAVYILPRPVGGIVTYVNKLEILTPYLVLAGLIVAVSALIFKKRKD